MAEVDHDTILHHAECLCEPLGKAIADEKEISTQIQNKPANTVNHIALGPLASPATILVGHTLNSAFRLSADAAKSGKVPDSVPADSIHRAILAEASLNSLHVLLEHGHNDEFSEGIFQDMGDFIKKMAPTVSRLAPKVLGAAMQPVLRMGVDWLHNYNSQDPSKVKPLVDHDTVTPAPAEGFFNFQTHCWPVYDPRKFNSSSPLLNHLKTAAAETAGVENDGATEGLFGSILKGGMKLLGGLLENEMVDENEEGFWGDLFHKAKNVVVKTIPIIADAITSKPQAAQPPATESADAEGLFGTIGGILGGIFGESAFDEPDKLPSAGISGDLVSRALCGEAAAYALSKADPDELHKRKITHAICKHVHQLAPQVVQYEHTCHGQLKTIIKHHHHRHSLGSQVNGISGSGQVSLPLGKPAIGGISKKPKLGRMGRGN